jgi:hypothetical protein
MHVLADVQDTPWSTLSHAPVGLGVDWADHVIPSQLSATVPAGLISLYPTAVHELAVRQEAPRSRSAGLAIGCSDQLVPSQRSATVSPTAVQAEGDVHDTPESCWLVFEGLAIDHWVPFQRSASVPSRPELSTV